MMPPDPRLDVIAQRHPGVRIAPHPDQAPTQPRPASAGVLAWWIGAAHALAVAALAAVAIGRG